MHIHLSYSPCVPNKTGEETPSPNLSVSKDKILMSMGLWSHFKAQAQEKKAKNCVIGP